MFLRILWLAITVFALALFIFALPARHAQLQTVSLDADTRVGELHPQDAQALFDLGLSPRFYADYFTTLEAISAIPFVLVSTILFWRKGEDWVVFLISTTGILFGTMGVPVVAALVSLQPAWTMPALFLRNIASLGFILQLFVFPDGRFIPPRTRWLAYLWVGYLIAATFFPSIAPPAGIASLRKGDIPLLFWVFLWMGLGVYAQVYRYRKISTAIQRQQTKFVILGLIVAFFTAYVTFFAVSVLNISSNSPVASLQIRIFYLTITLLVALPVLPLSVGFSILRYRLWDIDVFLRRTLVYAILTALLALLYFSLVIFLEGALRSLVGGGGQVATVVSTLSIAALFTPLRRRVQDFIDRRFYRRKYNAELALAQFAAAARNETDLEALTAQVVDIVNKTMQPEQANLWLRVDDQVRAGAVK